MKSMRKRVMSIMICALMGITTFAGVGSLFPEEVNAATGATASCGEVGYSLGSFNGSAACVNADGDLHICEANFPDAVFMNTVKTTEKTHVSDVIINNDGNDVISITEAKLPKINCINRGASSLKGIEYFTSISILNCHSNKLTELDLSKQTALKMIRQSKKGAPLILWQE